LSSRNVNDRCLTDGSAASAIAAATANLDHPGALGEWLLPTNISTQLEGTLGSAQGTFQSANSNLTILVENLARSLDSLAGITSNLNDVLESFNSDEKNHACQNVVPTRPHTWGELKAMYR